MPRKSSTTAIADDSIVVCIESHFTNRFWPVGSRVRRSTVDPFVASLWVEDGADDAAIQRQRYENSAEVMNPDYWANENYGGPPPAKPMVRCTKPVQVSTSAPSTGALLEGSIPGLVPVTVVINPGDLLDAGHPLVVKYPDCFEPVKDGE